MILFKPLEIKKLVIKNPVILAPLCGITDAPFRRICSYMGSSMVFTEMVSSTAILYNNPKTLEMMKTHESEYPIGVQLSARNPEELKNAVEKVNDMGFSAIDINMGCPVKKVVNSGGGSSVIRDIDKVYSYVKSAREVTDLPLSAKIRIGWDRNSINGLEIADAVEKGGADFITVHGRTRKDMYSGENNLEVIKQIKQSLRIPVIGNGNLFTLKDVIEMKEKTNVDGIMLARGALGNPFFFKTLTTELQQDYKPSINEWRDTIIKHISFFKEAYENVPKNVVTMRKHLLWYCKDWTGSKKLRGLINNIQDIGEAEKIIIDFSNNYHDEFLQV